MRLREGVYAHRHQPMIGSIPQNHSNHIVTSGLISRKEKELHTLLSIWRITTKDHINRGLSASVPEATQATPVPQFILHISIKHSFKCPKQPNMWSWLLRCVCIAVAQYNPKVSHINKGAMVTGWDVGEGLSLGEAARLGRQSRLLDGQDRKED